MDPPDERNPKIFILAPEMEMEGLGLQTKPNLITESIVNQGGLKYCGK